MRGRPLQLGAQRVCKSLQLSARLREEKKRETLAECTVRTVSVLARIYIKNSSVDVAPTLGVNHVYLVLWFSFLFAFSSFIFLCK